VAQIGAHVDLIEADGLYRELYDPDWAKEQKKLREERIEKLVEETLGAEEASPA